MKAFVVALFLAFVALSEETASHHRRHKGSDVGPTLIPIEVVEGNGDDGGDGDEGDFEWPQPARIKNFEVPDIFKGEPGSEAAPSPARHHGKSKHKSHSH